MRGLMWREAAGAARRWGESLAAIPPEVLQRADRVIR